MTATSAPTASRQLRVRRLTADGRRKWDGTAQSAKERQMRGTEMTGLSGNRQPVKQVHTAYAPHPTPSVGREMLPQQNISQTVTRCTMPCEGRHDWSPVVGQHLTFLRPPPTPISTAGPPSPAVVPMARLRGARRAISRGGVSVGRRRHPLTPRGPRRGGLWVHKGVCVCVPRMWPTSRGCVGVGGGGWGAHAYQWGRRPRHGPSRAPTTAWRAVCDSDAPIGTPQRPRQVPRRRIGRRPVRDRARSHRSRPGPAQPTGGHWVVRWVVLGGPCGLGPAPIALSAHGGRGGQVLLCEGGVPCTVSVLCSDETIGAGPQKVLEDKQRSGGRGGPPGDEGWAPPTLLLNPQTGQTRTKEDPRCTRHEGGPWDECARSGEGPSGAFDVAPHAAQSGRLPLAAFPCPAVLRLQSAWNGHRVDMPVRIHWGIAARLHAAGCETVAHGVGGGGSVSSTH